MGGGLMQLVALTLQSEIVSYFNSSVFTDKGKQYKNTEMENYIPFI